MRILFVSHARKNPDGGASRVYHLLQDGLTARGHTVKTLHYEDFEIPAYFEKFVSRMFLPYAASRRAAKEELGKYDVIMTSNGMLFPLFKKLRHHAHHPLLVNHLHGLSYFDHQARITETMRGHMSISWTYRLLTGQSPIRFDSYGSQFADLTIAQNGRDLDFLIEKGFSPTVSIGLPVHPDIHAAGSLSTVAEDRDSHSILWFGSWVERKGCYYLPGAFKEIVESDPEARLTIGGTGLSSDKVKSFFAPELRSRITVLSRISLAEQVAIYGRHSIFLFPSLSEGFGFALLEAMSMGLAAVTTQTGVGGDWVHDLQEALIVPPASGHHLAKAVLTLIGDTQLRCQIAKSGQKLARLFTQERFVDEYESAFQSFSRNS